MSKNIICFGEVLWDLLPNGAVPGGAPMNVAIRLQSLGFNAQIISKTGKDQLGTDLKTFLKNNQVNTTLLQTDPQQPTGKVNVSLDNDGIATYDIVYPCAWDKIELTEAAVKNVKQADAFIFGSLACRDAISKNTLWQLLDSASFKIFDVNFRPPFYEISLIEELIKKSDLVKLNDEELLILSKALGSDKATIEENITFLSTKLGIASICVTMGEKGAVLFTNNKFHTHNGYKVKVADTVGAGDSFLAALIYKLLSGADPDETIDFASAVGALVASKTGANSPITMEDIKHLKNQ